METDHQPPVPLLNRTNHNSLSARTLWFRFDYTMSQEAALHCRHTFLCSSCLNLQHPYLGRSRHSSSLVPLFPFCQQTKTVWTSTRQLNKRTAPVASLSPSANRNGLTDLNSYWHVRGDFTHYDNLLLYTAVISYHVPKNLQATTLHKIHKDTRHSKVPAWHATSLV